MQLYGPIISFTGEIAASIQLFRWTIPKLGPKSGNSCIHAAIS